MLIRGVVRDVGGAALAGAVVAFVDAPVDVPDIAAVTGGDGTFTVAAPAPGRYRLGVRAPEYDYREVELDVVDDVDVEATLTRRPSSGGEDL